MRNYMVDFPYGDITPRCTVKDAWKEVGVTTKYVDALNGKSANGAECALGNCAMRERGNFPHAVLGVNVTKSLVYVLAKGPARGRPGLVIRYRHYAYGRIIEQFDRMDEATAEERANRVASADQEIRLYPPGSSVKIGARKHKNSRVTRANPTTRRRSAPRGFFARATTLKKWKEEQRNATGSR